MDSILSWDYAAMVFLNLGKYHNGGLDFFMWMNSQILIWLPVILMFIYVLVKNKKRDALAIIGMTIFVFLLCDQISSSILKPLIARSRPSRDPLVMNLLQYVNDYRGGLFGFPSSHAANSFGFAIFSALIFRHKAYSSVVLLWAALCAYTRLYLGVHFPTDIICGTILGVCVGFFCYWIYSKFLLRPTGYYVKFSDKTTSSGFLYSDVLWLIWTLVVIEFILVFAGFNFW